MIKKLLAIFTITIATMTLVSCDTAPETVVLPISDVHVEVNMPTRGFWDGDTFISEYFGLRFNLPEGWTAMTESELAALLSGGDVMPAPEGTQVPQYAFENMGEEAYFYDMFTFGGSFFTAIQGVMMWIEWFDRDLPLSEAELLQSIVAQANNTEEWELVIKEDPIRIGAYYWHPADSRIYDENGYLHTTLMFVRADGRFSKTIGISYLDIEAIDEFLKYFEAY